MITIEELIVRVERATGPDRELDADIAKHFGWTYEVDDEDLWDCWRDPEGKARYLPKLTSSVDAAIALAERVLPGCDICTQDIHTDFRQEGEPRHVAEIMADLEWKAFDGPPEPVYAVSGSGKSNSRAIAILIAVLSALQSKESTP